MASKLSEALIRENASAESFQRGREYQRRGAVISFTRSDDLLLAMVLGSQPAPYTVEVILDESGVSAAGCTCPYDRGGWCKHIVAALLTYLNEPEAAEIAPTLEEELSTLDREQLQTVILKLVERDPDLAETVEVQIVLAQTQPTDASPSPASATPPRPAPIDTQPFRRQVQGALHSLDGMRNSEAYWHIGSVVNEVWSILQPARDLIEAGDGRNALRILEGITEEYVEGWTMLDDSDGEMSGFFYALAPLWTEALLSDDLTASEREAQIDELSYWADEVGEYGVDYVFQSAIEAAEQGWDYPPLLRILQGELPENVPPHDDALFGIDEITVARLNVLERQGRYQEFLYLAEAKGQTQRYATMLVRLGRVAEAVEYGMRYMESAGSAFTLAKALHEGDHTDDAIRIAEYGLKLGDPAAPLATWLRDLATSLGRIDQALPAALTAFRTQPTLSNYLAIQELASEDWPDYRDELLTTLRRHSKSSPQGSVDVFLHEGLIQDAINTVDGTWSYDLLDRVAQAATTSHPDWVVKISRQQAESVMGQGQSRHYHHAVRWLRHARAAYRALKQEAEWTAYLAGLIDLHHRKYKLRPMLEALRT